MTFDKRLFADKLVRCCQQFGLDPAALAEATGIDETRIVALRGGFVEPTGDEILIFADIFKIDFKFFVSGDAQTPFEQLEILYRRYGDRIRAQDRQAIAELLYLCDTEEYLQTELGRPPSGFSFTKKGTYFKAHGEDAARALRAHLGLDSSALVGDVFAVARRLGIHVFRRRLSDSNISGVTIRHPSAGACVLVNFDEDPYRQRFTLAHEVGHVYLDSADDDVVVSFAKWDTSDLVEVRANTFASHFLVPRAALQLLRGAPSDDSAFVALAHRLEVNAETLARSLADAKLIDATELARLRGLRLPRAAKSDPELAFGLTERQRKRKREMLERGLSQSYVQLCFAAYCATRISRGRLAEALLVDQDSLGDIAALYGEQLAHA